MPLTTLTITLDDALASRVTAAVAAQGKSADTIVAACIEQQLEVALRHAVLVERMETVDAQIDAIARFVEKASSGGGLDPVDLFRICRYPKDQ
ncbi:hypothetical protein P7D22_08655 [Lichenihabitans sp. Uapishka_5]|uniref:hypothetical protein n=1 Tax=Lichenihabitans sp. Uapishka_5 TaxID=3037302 RepID=UPI0029E7D3C9|nr:hypothetical protein [Lichenihabitans sp. Uapishka_5]MDX7951246.1 hypothetical protein [Lichenihabitans sp. Uapishka_5]